MDPIRFGAESTQYVSMYKHLEFITHEHLSPQRNIETDSRNNKKCVNVFNKLQTVGIGKSI